MKLSLVTQPTCRGVRRILPLPHADIKQLEYLCIMTLLEDAAKDANVNAQLHLEEALNHVVKAAKVPEVVQ